MNHAFTSDTPHETLPTSSKSLHERLLSGTDKAYVLEIRNADLTVQDWGGRQLWRKISEAASQMQSFLDNEPYLDAYPEERQAVGSDYGMLSGSVFGAAAMHAVEYWPMPTFVVGPPQHPRVTGRPADRITDGRNRGGLPMTLFLWQDDEATSSSQAMIERLFAFFDANPDMPEALIVANDGDWERAMNGPPRSGMRSETMGVPIILHTHAALLVSRSDRVDAQIRPYAKLNAGDVKLRDSESVETRFWKFYWRKDDAYAPDGFGVYYNTKCQATGKECPLPPTMAAEWWKTQLPEFWADIGRQGDYKPTPYLPIRWTGTQLKKFDTAPLVGYLHRPVRIPLRDKESHPLTHADLVANVRQGWREALTAVNGGDKPSRLFFDTSEDSTWGAVLAEALIDEPSGLDLSQEPVGYDMYHRAGNTGAVSALAQIVLATMAGHNDGRVSATVNVGTDGHADIVMVTPADEQQREKNTHAPGSYFLLGKTQ